METQNKVTAGKELWLEHVAKSIKATEPPGALVNAVFWDLKDGKNLRMLQKGAGFPAAAGDI